jgi:hypothetical protein
MEEMKLKKRIMSLSLFCAVFIGLVLVVPATIAVPPSYTSEYGWASLASPVIDDSADVFKYNTSQLPTEGSKGAFHPEIDILNISLVSYAKASLLDLVIWFAASPAHDYLEYNYQIYIDNDSDGVADYWIFSGNVILSENKITVIDFYLKRIADGYYYNSGSGWGPTVAATSWGITTNDLHFYYMDEIIPEIASSRIAMWITYSGESGKLYTDFAPFKLSSGIPGFTLGLVLFGLLTLLGFAVLLQKNHIRF